MSLVLSILLASIIALLPILGWAYMFSYLDNEPLHARRFVLGIGIGAIGVIPNVYMKEIFQFLHIESFQVFRNIADGAPMSFSVTSFALFLSTAIVAVLLAGWLFQGSDGWKNRKTLATSIASVALCVPLFAVLIFLFHSPSVGSVQISIAGATLSGFVSIALAYFIVGSVEEGGKYLGLFGGCSASDMKKTGLLVTAFIALGFAFLENILYLSATLSGREGGMFGVWFSRSLISVGIHVLCALIATFPVIRFLRRGDTSGFPIVAFFTGILFAVLVHASFNIAISYGKTGIIALYAIFGYAFVTRAFYRVTPSEE